MGLVIVLGAFAAICFLPLCGPIGGVIGIVAFVLGIFCLESWRQAALAPVVPLSAPATLPRRLGPSPLRLPPSPRRFFESPERARLRRLLGEEP